jgi:cytochrome d ubiquinol oxidase subunit II
MSKASGVIIFAAAMGVLSAGFPSMKERDKPTFNFATSAVTIVLTVIGLFVALFPRLMVSSLNPEWSLTIYNAASTPYTLTIMTVAAVIFVPVVLIYQGWTYKIFKERITSTK